MPIFSSVVASEACPSIVKRETHGNAERIHPLHRVGGRREAGVLTAGEGETPPGGPAPVERGAEAGGGPGTVGRVDVAGPARLA